MHHHHALVDAQLSFESLYCRTPPDQQPLISKSIKLEHNPELQRLFGGSIFGLLFLAHYDEVSPFRPWYWKPERVDLTCERDWAFRSPSPSRLDTPAGHTSIVIAQ
jgi:hypothetical protein